MIEFICNLRDIIYIPPGWQCLYATCMKGYICNLRDGIYMQLACYGLYATCVTEFICKLRDIIYIPPGWHYSDNLTTSQLLSSVLSIRQAFKILWKFPVVVFITVNQKSDTFLPGDCSVQFMWSSFSCNQMQSSLKDCLHSIFICVSACFLFKFVCSLPFSFLVQNFPDYSKDF